MVTVVGGRGVQRTVWLQLLEAEATENSVVSVVGG